MSKYTEQFIEEDDKVKYVRTFDAEVSIEIYLTKDYLDNTERRIVETYLDHAVKDIMTRHEGVIVR